MKYLLRIYKFQYQAFEQQNPSRLKKDNLHRYSPESFESFKFVSHKAIMLEEFDSGKDSHSTKFD